MSVKLILATKLNKIFWDNTGMQDTITLPELEAAINFWRQRSPSVGEELRLCAQASSLATPYALMIIERRTQMPVAEMSDKAQAALNEWFTQR
ncbi:MAG: hypothetical protein RLY91_1236 [Pseudomonadota bacterium]|jgi:hypothetical protein